MIPPKNQGQEEAPTPPDCQACTLQRLWELLPLPHSANETNRYLPETTTDRQHASASAKSLDQDEYLPEKIADGLNGLGNTEPSPEKTVLYLAYGSNLCSETFLGRRGIKPLSQVNVVVPALRLTFDLSGLPYAEPCFAGTRMRHVGHEIEDEHKSNEIENSVIPEKLSLLQDRDSDRNAYKGPLVGVVYEVTLADYATIIATEGGGRGYKDIVVDCYPFPKGYDPTDPIPDCPETEAMKAHTLLSPAGMDELRSRALGKRPSRPIPGVRPNPCYAQPSARYLKLITTGATEHNLPLSYQTYLSQIKPYRITSTRQRVGKVIFLGLWGPMFLVMLALSRTVAGPDGRSPQWVNKFWDMMITTMWNFYDNIFVHIFGDGERTIEDK